MIIIVSKTKKQQKGKNFKEIPYFCSYSYFQAQENSSRLLSRTNDNIYGFKQKQLRAVIIYNVIRLLEVQIQ